MSTCGNSSTAVIIIIIIIIIIITNSYHNIIIVIIIIIIKNKNIIMIVVIIIRIIITIPGLHHRTAVRNGADVDLLSPFDSISLGSLLTYTCVPAEKLTLWSGPHGSK